MCKPSKGMENEEAGRNRSENRRVAGEESHTAESWSERLVFKAQPYEVLLRDLNLLGAMVNAQSLVPVLAPPFSLGVIHSFS